MTKTTRDGTNRRSGGTPLQQFEWSLRADGRLNGIGRLAWHLTALSAKRPANMTVGKLAAQLGITDWVVHKGLRLVVEQRLFTKTAKGFRRARNSDFARMVRRCQKLNLTVRLAWFLVDLLSGSKEEHVTIGLSGLAEELNSSPDLVSVAAKKLVDLGLFCRRRHLGDRYAYSAAIANAQSAGDGMTIDQDGNPVDDTFDRGGAPDTGDQLSYWDHFEKYGVRHDSNRSSVRNN